MKKMTPKEKTISLQMERFFLGNGEASIPELVERHWDINIERDRKEDYAFYEKKTRRILGTVRSHLLKMDGDKTRMRRLLGGVGKLWLMATHKGDKNDRFPWARKYKIVCTPKDEEIVCRLGFNKIEGAIKNHEERTTEAVERHPKVFKDMVQFKKITVPFLAAESEQKLLGGKHE